MKIYNYDTKGYLIGESFLDDSDKCPITGVFLIPGQATEKEILLEKEGFKIKFNSEIKDWEYEKILTTEEKKIQGLLPLEEGEKVEKEKLIKVESPGEFYSWNFKKLEWYEDEQKVFESTLPSDEELQNLEFETKVLEKLIEWGVDINV